MAEICRSFCKFFILDVGWVHFPDIFMVADYCTHYICATMVLIVSKLIFGEQVLYSFARYVLFFGSLLLAACTGVPVAPNDTENSQSPVADGVQPRQKLESEIEIEKEPEPDLRATDLRATDLRGKVR